MKLQDKFVDQEIDTTDKWHKMRGVWSMREGVHVFEGSQDVTEDQEGLLLCDIPLDNSEISAAVSVLDKPEGSFSSCAHIVFYFKDRDDFCVAGIGGWDCLYAIGRRLPPEMGAPEGEGEWKRLMGDGRHSQIEQYRWYPLTVSFAAGEIELRLSNIPMFRFFAGRGQEAGSFGFRGYGNCRARFRINRIVRKISRSDVGARLADTSLGFMHLDALRAVAERDLGEVRGLDADVSPKATVILLGSIAEALLLDALWYKETQQPGSTGITDDKLGRWTLNDLIDKANELRMLGRSTYATSHILREYRNLVHPAKEEAMMLAPRPAQAVAAVDFLLALIKDLSKGV